MVTERGLILISRDCRSRERTRGVQIVLGSMTAHAAIWWKFCLFLLKVSSLHILLNEFQLIRYLVTNLIN